jgi:hypothetical protein
MGLHKGDLMYEENCKPLAQGDVSVVFAEQLAEMKRDAAVQHAAELTPDSVVRWADKRNQHHFAGICRRLILPGSGIRGLQNLKALADLAHDSKPCLLCLNHRSNFDVPTLCTLMEDQGDPDLFDRIIWVAGRKLEEDVGMTGLLVQCFNRALVAPHSWFDSPHSDSELHQARQLNIAAERAIAKLRYAGSVFALFPTGTRIRDDDESTKQAIGETYSYLRIFQYMVLCHIDGCTLPVSRDRDLTHETPRLDRMIYTFGSVHRTEDWLAQAEARFAKLDRRAAAARAITEDIEALAHRSASS